MDDFTIKGPEVTEVSPIDRKVRDAELAPGVNTRAECLLENLDYYEQNHLEFKLRVKIVAYPEHVVDLLTLYSPHRLVVIENARYFFNNDERLYETFANIYLAVINRSNELFAEYLGDPKVKPEKILLNNQVRASAAKILDFYASKK
jgi:hypothetical protein